jgi:hypothetical protein
VGSGGAKKTVSLGSLLDGSTTMEPKFSEGYFHSSGEDAIGDPIQSYVE